MWNDKIVESFAWYVSAIVEEVELYYMSRNSLFCNISIIRGKFLVRFNKMAQWHFVETKVTDIYLKQALVWHWTVCYSKLVNESEVCGCTAENRIPPLAPEVHRFKNIQVDNSTFFSYWLWCLVSLSEFGPLFVHDTIMKSINQSIKPTKAQNVDSEKEKKWTPYGVIMTFVFLIIMT